MVRDSTMTQKIIFSSPRCDQLLKFLCLGIIMAMISSPASADQSKTGQKLVEDGYQVMDEYELETYLVNRTVYTRVRKANGELSKSSYPSYHHESGKRWLEVKNKIYETAWGFEDGMACYEGYRTGKWGCLIWYIKGDSVIACNSKKKDCKYDQSESRDGDSEGLMN